MSRDADLGIEWRSCGTTPYADNMLKRHGMRMPRTLVSEPELREWLDSQIQKHEECADCRFGGIMRLRGADDAGCNWSEPVLRCSGQPARLCVPIAIRVLTEARDKFNLAD